MTRIGVSLTGIERTLLDNLARANVATVLSVLRTSTGQKINRPSDDPSGFVMLSGLQSQLSGVTAGIRNATAAGSMVSQTQTALGQMQSQLTTIRTELLKDADGSLSSSQRAESQAKIDAAITQINTLTKTTIGGRRVLDGSANYLITGRDSSQVANVSVIANGGGTQTISGEVTASATKASLVYTGTGDDKITADATLQLSGNRGTVSLEVTTGQTLASVADSVNQNSYLTGVTAAVDTMAHTLTFTSVDYGSSAKAAVAVSSGTFVVVGGDGEGTALGTNAAAMINGQAIASTDSRAQGNSFTMNENGFRYEVDFTPGFTGSFDTMTVSGSALTFQLGDSAQSQATLALPGLQPALLGGPSGTLDQLQSGGPLSGLGSNTAQAIRVVDEAAGMLTVVTGQVDGFATAAISSTSELLASMQLDLGEAIESLDKTDDAEELQRQAHYQLLAENSASGLAILNHQREYMARIIRNIAGLY